MCRGHPQRHACFGAAEWVARCLGGAVVAAHIPTRQHHQSATGRFLLFDGHASDQAAPATPAAKGYSKRGGGGGGGGRGRAEGAGHCRARRVSRCIRCTLLGAAHSGISSGIAPTASTSPAGHPCAPRVAAAPCPARAQTAAVLRGLPPSRCARFVLALLATVKCLAGLADTTACALTGQRQIQPGVPACLAAPVSDGETNLVPCAAGARARERRPWRAVLQRRGRAAGLQPRRKRVLWRDAHGRRV